MGNRDATVMAGAGMKLELFSGLEASLTLLHDALDQIGGSEVSLSLDRSFRAGTLRLTPGAGINWTSARLANHDYGVSSSKAVPGRPAYDTGDTLSFETGIRALAELTEDWWFAASLAVEFLPGDVTGSPVVSDSYLLKGFLAVQYVF
jgi:outer membrane protein